MSLDCYPACANCKGKTVEKTDLLNVCNKCGMVPKKDHCSTQRKSKLLLSVAGGGYMTLTAFGHLLTQITDSETVTVSLCSFFWIYTHKQCLQKVTHRKNHNISHPLYSNNLHCSSFTLCKPRAQSSCISSRLAPIILNQLLTSSNNVIARTLAPQCPAFS